ncbi:MAG: hypothetical protein H6709_11875 [Kofleriaceae bacterium]|nr:hypothetical protein [Kofleriaceae bacterium]
MAAATAPAWSPFERADHLRFVAAVRAALAGRDVACDRAALDAGAVPMPRDAQRRSWDLRALATACADVDADGWAGLVAADLAAQFGAGPRRGAAVAARAATTPTAAAAPAAVATPLDVTMLRTQVWSRANPAVAALALDGIVHRSIGATLVEVATWDLHGAGELTVRRGAAELGGLDDDDVLTRGRIQAVASDVDHLRFEAVAVAGAPAEIVVSNRFYLGACALELLDRTAPDRVTAVCPVSTHHWILHEVGAGTTVEVLAAMRALAATILDGATLAATERLGDDLLWWPGGGTPAAISIAGDRPVLTDAMAATIAAAGARDDARGA